MSRLTLVHHRGGISTQCSLDCVCQNGAWVIPCTDPICESHPIGYLKAIKPPNYQMPAIRHPTFDTLHNLGYVSALNKFDIDVVFNHFVKI